MKIRIRCAACWRQCLRTDVVCDWHRRQEVKHALTAREATVIRAARRALLADIEATLPDVITGARVVHDKRRAT